MRNSGLLLNNINSVAGLLTMWDDAMDVANATRDVAEIAKEIRKCLLQNR
jgi:hypothetical protein